MVDELKKSQTIFLAGCAHRTQKACGYLITPGGKRATRLPTAKINAGGVVLGGLSPGNEDNAASRS
ncbi:hypothetical protein [uncultured Dysosmobacter sp.]|uniref:hypothetical protein n=1 Tax=uncultured Dysosmobacter sp. TaxID=2591384 RepID=UPI00260D721F|nr:hypothetical protein [uncultured Dysosmobacter sp.]